MRKINLVLVIAALFIGNIAFAQNDSNTSSNTNQSNEIQKIKIGIYGDFGFSYLKPKSNDYRSDGSSGSYSYGLVVDNNFTKNYTFSTGIRFSSYGGNLSFNDSLKVNSVMETGVMKRKYRINYLEIPLSLKLKTNQMGYLTPFVHLGLSNGFRLSSYADDEFSVSKSSTKVLTENSDINDGTAFYRLSLDFGVGAEYAISQSLSAFAILSFQNGLTNSLNGTSFASENYTETNNSAMLKKFALTVGLMF